MRVKNERDKITEISNANLKTNKILQSIFDIEYYTFIRPLRPWPHNIRSQFLTLPKRLLVFAGQLSKLVGLYLRYRDI